MNEEQILNAFKKTLEMKKEIRLVNTYKGLPISFPATVVAVNAPNVVVKTDRSQIVCMYRDHETFIQGELLGTAIKGYVTQLDLAKLEAILSYFEIPESSFNNRSHIRVEPDNPISGNIKTKEARIPFRGQLADISQSGMGIFIEERLFHPTIYRPGAEITIEINLPNLNKVATRTTVQYGDRVKEEQFDSQASRINLFPELSKQSTSLSSATYTLNPGGSLELRGTVVKAHREQAQRRYRIGIRLASNENNSILITQFINARQAEIINEIRAEYSALVTSLTQKPR